MKDPLLLVLCLFIAPAAIWSQEGETGTVLGFVCSQNGDLLSGATVFIAGTNTGAMTGEFGQFIIDVPAGPAVLEVNMVGMYMEELEIDVIAGDTLELYISLDWAPPFSGEPSVIIRI